MKKLTQAEACFLVFGSGLGTGILAIPYAAREMGVLEVVLSAAVACVVSVLLHWCVAELVLRSRPSVQLMAVFRKHLFRGRWGDVAAKVFFSVLALLLLLNLTLYLSCAAQTLQDTFGWPALAAKLAFYAAASAVVLFGLKSVGVGEKYAMLLLFAVLAVLCGLTVGRAPFSPLPLAGGGGRRAIALYSLIMFSLSALFSAPQIAVGLENRRKVRRCLAIGIGANAALTTAFALFVKSALPEISPVATTGLAARFGPAVGGACALFVALAMLTSFLSIALAQLDMLQEETHCGRKVCFLLATLPALLLSLILPLSYRDYIELVGGVVAIIIALLVLPAYRRAIKSGGEESLLGRWGQRRALTAFLFVAYLVMAIGSFL